MPITVDRRGFDRQISQLQSARSMGARAALVAMGKVGAKWLVEYSPRDTNRYVRAWMMAANQAGLGPWSLPALEKSAYLKVYAERLSYQRTVLQKRVIVLKERALYWQTLYANRYQSKNRRDKWAADCLKHKAEAEKFLAKAEALLARNDEESMLLNQYAIVIGARRKRSGASDLRTLGDLGRVSPRPYGGEGAIREFGNQAYLWLHNMEPHAQIVESRLGVVRKALKMTRQMGLVKARAAVARIIAERVKGGVAIGGGGPNG